MDFLSNLMARSLQEAEIIMPRPVSLFEPAAGEAGPATPADPPRPDTEQATERIGRPKALAPEEDRHSGQRHRPPARNGRQGESAHQAWPSPAQNTPKPMDVAQPRASSAPPRPIASPAGATPAAALPAILPSTSTIPAVSPPTPAPVRAKLDATVPEKSPSQSPQGMPGPVPAERLQPMRGTLQAVLDKLLGETPTSQTPVKRLEEGPAVVRTVIEPLQTVIEKPVESAGRTRESAAGPLPQPSEGTVRRARPERLAARPKESESRWARTAPFAPPAADFAVPVSLQPKAPPPQPTVRVTIGRVEVRATTEAPQVRKPRPRPAVMTLDEYLKQQAGGGR